MSGQQLATVDQSSPPDVTATLAARRGLKLPAFPTATPPAAAPALGPTAVAPDTARELPRAVMATTGSLRRFPLAPGRPVVDREHPGGGTPLTEAPPRDAAAPPHTARGSARRTLLPVAPTEPQAIAQELSAPASPPLTGKGSIIDRKATAHDISVVPDATRRTRKGRLCAALPDSPAMLAGMLLAIGVLVLVWTFATRPSHPYDALLYLNALGLCLVGALVYGLSAVRARRERRDPTDKRHRS